MKETHTNLVRLIAMSSSCSCFSSPSCLFVPASAPPVGLAFRRFVVFVFVAYKGMMLSSFSWVRAFRRFRRFRNVRRFRRFRGFVLFVVFVVFVMFVVFVVFVFVVCVMSLGAPSSFLFLFCGCCDVY